MTPFGSGILQITKIRRPKTTDGKGDSYILKGNSFLERDNMFRLLTERLKRFPRFLETQAVLSHYWERKLRDNLLFTIVQVIRYIEGKVKGN